MPRTHETSVFASFDKRIYPDHVTDPVRMLGGEACLLAAVIATETRIPLFTKDSDDTELKSKELGFFFADLSSSEVLSYAQQTEGRTAAVAVYRRTRHTITTEHAKPYEASLRDLVETITSLGVLSTEYAFAETMFPEQVTELAPTAVVVEAAQMYSPTERTIYNISHGTIAQKLGASRRQPGSIATRFPDQPLNLFTGSLTDITEYSPVFQRQPIVRYAAPTYE